MKITKLFAFFALAMIIGCTDNDNSNEEIDCPTTDFPFVKDGNYWEYDMTIFGTKTDLSMSLNGCSSRGFNLEMYSYDISSGKYKTRNGYWWQDGDQLKTDPSGNSDVAIIYEKDLKVGDFWTYIKNDGREISYEVIALNQVVTVPAGTFICTEIEYNGGQSLIYMNDDIGVVKEDAFITLMELRSYVLN